MPAPVYLGGDTFVPPTAPEFHGMAAVEWTGFDGVTWDLMSRESGVVLGPGIRGFAMPPIKRYSSTSTLAGSRWTGFRVEEREPFWPLLVRHRQGQAWIDKNRAFWRTLHPQHTGRWSVTQPGGEKRTLICRYDDDGDPSYRHDPAIYGWFAYALKLVAEEPFWLGEQVRGRFTIGDPRDFFGAGGPPFWISPSHTFGSAVITNPGDVDAWPTWRLTGPFSGASVGIGGSVLTIPFGLAAGQVLTIDSNPWGPLAVLDDGTDRTGDISDLGFAPIPAGESIPLAIDMVGAGRVDVAITPRYYAAW